MISNYEIKKINNEEVLYLYFDFDNEFGKLKGKTKKKKLKEEINDYIKNNNIKFAGKKVAIVAGGLLIGTLLLNTPAPNNDYQILNNTPVSVLLTDGVNENTEVNQIETNEIEVNEKNNSEEKINETKKDAKINTTNTTVQNNKPNVVKEEVKLKENKNETTDVVEDDKEYVTVYRTNEVINIELEEYVVGVVGAEMPASFNEQALMSQAILARTYALKSIKNNTRLTDSSSTQNYKSVNELKNMWGSNFNDYYNKIKNAVNNTKGMYLTYNGEIIEAVYHSTSNGKTENAENVWGNSFPYLISVESNYDSTNPSFIKEEFITYDILSSKLNTTINVDTEFNVLSKTSGSRVDKIEINGNIFSGVEIRNLLGLRSADFNITKTDNGISFQTKGYGHGVGMSQYGANGMAKNGYNYEQILKHYYTGVTISKS